MAEFKDWAALDIRVGEIIRAETFPKAKRAAYKIWVDFGEEIGVKKSSAQITELYEPDDLVGRQVLGIVNFPVKQVADFMSEALVLGVYTDRGVVLIQPAETVGKGSKLG